MKSIKVLLALALAAGFASASFAASETAPALIKVPKTEEAMQATRATTARDTTNGLVAPAGHKTKSKETKSAAPKTKSKQGKPSAHKAKAEQGKESAAKKHSTKAPRRAHAAK